MSSVFDALQNPTAALSELYEQNKPQGIDSFPSTVTSHFSAILKPQDVFQQIPVLDLYHPPESFPDRSLVVFNAMVQDTSISPELYLATRNSNECGGWGLADEIAPNEDVQHENLRECSTFWTVSIPGLSSWCYDENQLAPPPPYISIQKHKYPIPNTPHIGVQVKVYDEKLAQPIRTTDIMSFVGILNFEPLHSSINLPSSANVPTLHTFFCTPISRTIVPRSFPGSSLLPSIAGLRKELIQWIADEGLGGDCIAAEWVFLCALARVRSRHPPVLPLSLTIAGFPPPPDNLETQPALYHVLSQIFPLISILPLTLDTLNNTAFCPESKDEDLYSGRLQQPKGTVLVLTEGAITEGGIFNKGVMNIRATQDMMSEQTLQYIFPFSNFQFETEVNFLVTTEGKRSTFFKTDVTVPLRLSVSNDLKHSLYKSEEDITFPSVQKLFQFRELAGGSMIGNVAVAEALGKHVEDDFIRERSTENDKGASVNGTTFTPDDLIQRMLVARLVALSLHQTEVTVDNWENAKKLEGQTKNRV
ncbi:hypothetical protein CVT25_015511 [Psilocybe cyanescens]|uniref:Mini-chromosome maintenance complex-binding protein n=1 Tax=Psilocybe cyanescens TaxID=93625 RepID=A0A409WI09_PSICY|nr:hypothetical protein CVT25_015511 [Psilocybe cyanescens]